MARMIKEKIAGITTSRQIHGRTAARIPEKYGVRKQRKSERERDRVTVKERLGGRRSVRRCIIQLYRSEWGKQKCSKVKLEEQGTIDETEQKQRNNKLVDQNKLKVPRCSNNQDSSRRKEPGIGIGQVCHNRKVVYKH